MITCPKNKEKQRCLKYKLESATEEFNTILYLGRGKRILFIPRKWDPIDPVHPGSNTDVIVDVIRSLGSHGMIRDLLLLSPSDNLHRNIFPH